MALSTAVSGVTLFFFFFPVEMHVLGVRLKVSFDFDLLTNRFLF